MPSATQPSRGFGPRPGALRPAPRPRPCKAGSCHTVSGGCRHSHRAPPARTRGTCQPSGPGQEALENGKSLPGFAVTGVSSAPFYRGKVASAPFPTARRNGTKIFKCCVNFAWSFTEGEERRWSHAWSTPHDMSCAGTQPLAAERRGKQPCEGNKGTWVARVMLASRECWQTQLPLLGEENAWQGSLGWGSPAG